VSLRAATAALCALTATALSACGARPPATAPVRPVAPGALVQPTDQQLRSVARRWLTSYLRVEVAAGRRGDVAELLELSTRTVALQAVSAPRPVGGRYPPAGRLRQLQLLPALIRGHYTVQAQVARGHSAETWAIQLTASRRGPLVSGFRSAAPRTPGGRQA
jgi:hypothetical protein